MVELIFAFDYSIWLLAAIMLMAVLYSSVGHGGASGYLAAMALWGLVPDTMRPAALTMNIVVTGWLLFRFKPYKLISHRLFWPLVIASTPMAFIGGRWAINATAYQLLVGAMLVLAAVKMLSSSRRIEHISDPPTWLALIVGALLGLLAGLTGIGGGVFLSPILLIFGWCTMRESAAVAAGFILLNSSAGLSGYLLSGQPWPGGTSWLVLAAWLGCLVGAEMASHRAPAPVLQKLLALVLLIAGCKLAYPNLIG